MLIWRAGLTAPFFAARHTAGPIWIIWITVMEKGGSVGCLIRHRRNRCELGFCNLHVCKPFALWTPGRRHSAAKVQARNKLKYRQE